MLPKLAVEAVAEAVAGAPVEEAAGVHVEPELVPDLPVGKKITTENLHITLQIKELETKNN